jgi:uncharacterized phiE125 gp8 family phage protein
MTSYDIVDVSLIESSGGSAGTPTEPVTVAEAKARLIIDFDDDDELLSQLITSCRQTIENYCHISIVEKIVTVTADSSCYVKGYSNKFQELPYGPVKSFLSAGYMDQDTDLVTLDLNEGYFLKGSDYQSIRVPGNYENAILSYIAGYDECPAQLKEAILAEIVFRYETRGEKTNRYASQNVGLSEAAEYKAFPYRRMNWQ